MSLSMHDAVVPPFRQFLGALSLILDKAAAHCEARKIDPNAILTARLFPDMFTFTKQVQLTTDFAKGAVARLTGAEVPSWPDTETSFPELKARVAKAIAYVEAAAPAAFEGAATREIKMKLGGEDRVLSGATLLFQFSLPNFHFHFTTAYDILRHNGVELGKRDYMGPR